MSLRCKYCKGTVRPRLHESSPKDHVYCDKCQRGYSKSEALVVSTDKLLEERGGIYGDISHNVTCCKELMEVYLHWRERNNMIDSVGDYILKENAHNEIMRLVFHKIARIATGAVHADNYDDVAGYIHLAKDQVIPNG